MKSADRPQIIAFGDSALLLELGDQIDLELNRRVHALAKGVRDDGAWGTPVPAYASLLVPYDPAEMGVDEAVDRLSALFARAGTAAERAPVEADTVPGEGDTEPVEADTEPLEVPVRYGGEHGPDLDEVARGHGLRPQDIVALHSGVTYTVYMLGFAPGFAYLGSLSPELATPRRATPRERVPPGSVGIAGQQTAIYPMATPGGWQLIGRTDLKVWDPSAEPPALLQPGRRVRFRPVV
jgi:KipI family sensor histidine kinase inhibitor